MKLFIWTLVCIGLGQLGTGCATYYGGTAPADSAPAYLVEKGQVVAHYKLAIWQEPMFPNFFGRPVLVALVHEPMENLDSARLKYMLSSIPDDHVVERTAGQGETDRTLRANVATAISGVDNWDHFWLLSTDPCVVAIADYAPDAWYENEPSWTRMYNPSVCLVEEKFKSIAVNRYVVLREGVPIVIDLNAPETLGNLLAAHPWLENPKQD